MFTKNKKNNLTAYNLLCGAIHASSGQFSDYWDFAELIDQRYGDLPYDKDIVREYVLKDIKHRLGKKGLIDQHLALEHLVARDLAKALDKLETLPDLNDPEEQLKRTCLKTADILKELGLKFSCPKLFIVDKFPSPYHKMDWVALAADKSDQEQHGIKVGIYFLESELAPYYSQLTLAHELIHAIIGESDPYLLGRGLEEGIADLLGTLYIGSQLYSPRIAGNIFLHTRLGNKLPQVNRLYFDYTRQAFLVYLHFGLKGLVHLIQGGRKLIKEVEEKCLSGKIDTLSLPAGHWNSQLTKLGEDLLLGFVPDLVVSPLAAYIAEFARASKTIEDIATKANVDPKSVKEAIEEIQKRTFTLLVDRGKVIHSDLSFITKSGSLRYEIVLDEA